MMKYLYALPRIIQSIKLTQPLLSLWLWYYLLRLKNCLRRWKEQSGKSSDISANKAFSLAASGIICGNVFKLTTLSVTAFGNDSNLSDNISHNLWKNRVNPILMWCKYKSVVYYSYINKIITSLCNFNGNMKS